MERPQALLTQMQACVAGQRVVRNGVFGVRFASELTKKHWKFGQEKSSAATSGTLPCCQISRTRSRPIRTSAAPPLVHVNMHCRAVDGAYDTRKCHEAIAARDAHAVIPRGTARSGLN
jgi:hypothetical protein